MGKSLIILGSRPTDLYGYDTNRDGSTNEEVRARYKALRTAISQYIKSNGITDVYSTLDLGAEQYGAEAAVNAGAKLHSLIPYSGQDAKWPADKKANYQKLLQHSAEIKEISGAYDATASKKRLEYLRNLVGEEGAQVLGVFNGGEKDTAYYTINALTAECRSQGVDAPQYIDSKTLAVLDARPYPERPRIVSEERIEEITARNAGRAAGKYTRQERQEMSDIWKAYLDKLTLRPEHERDLLNRGFTMEQIKEFDYKSLPQTKEEADALVSSLLADGWDLSKAPGFPIAGDGGAYSTQVMKDGYFCPARDTETGLLYGMQIRNCDKEEAKKYGKYTWFSAGKNAIGLSSSQPAAYYEGSMTANIGGKERPVILITEGVLKCNLAYLGMGRQVGIVGMAGVYGQKGLYVYDENGEAERLNPDEARHLFKDAIVVECFDADFEKNKNVRNASYRIRNELVDYYGAYATCRMTWEDDGKGIDDYVVDCNRAGKDIHFNLSNVIMAGSPTHVVTNEYDKPETRHVEIKDISQSPLRGLGIDIKMEDVYAAGYRIQPKIETPAPATGTPSAAPTPTPAAATPVQQAPVQQGETEEQRKARKKVEHLGEWTGQRSNPEIKKLLPIRKYTPDDNIVDKAGKIVITVDDGSRLDREMANKIPEITKLVEDHFGIRHNDKHQILVSTSTPVGTDEKAVIIAFNGFDKSTQATGAMLSGVVSQLFYKEKPTIGRVFPMSDVELETATRMYGPQAQAGVQIEDPRKTMTTEVKLDETLLPNGDGNGGHNGIDTPGE